MGVDFAFLVSLTHHGQSQDEGGALFCVGIVSCHNRTPMQTSQASAIAQADAGGVLFHGPRRGLVVSVEDAFEHIVGDADARVAHFGSHGVALALHADGDAAALGCELQGVRKEVGQDVVVLLGVDPDGIVEVLVVHGQLYAMLLIADLEVLYHLSDNLLHMDGLYAQAHHVAFELVEVEQLVDELEQSGGVARNDLQGMALVVGVSALLDQAVGA